MKITELMGVIKVCTLKLNNPSNKQNPLWNIDWVCDRNILTQNNNRCYYLLVNDEIYKIGYSNCKGGIKETIEAYRNSDMIGQTSDRTHGIHIYITEELIKGNKVEFYFNYSPDIYVDITLMDGSIKSIKTSISGKELEIENVKLFEGIEGTKPKWNIQETTGSSWPEYIKEGTKNVRMKNPPTFEAIEERLKIKYNFNKELV